MDSLSVAVELLHCVGFAHVAGLLLGNGCYQGSQVISLTLDPVSNVDERVRHVL